MNPTPMYPHVLTAREKNEAVKESLFKPVNGRSLAGLTATKFDLGKYASNPAGHPIPDHMVKHVDLVWAERRRDRDGPYWQLMCFSHYENPLPVPQPA